MNDYRRAHDCMYTGDDMCDSFSVVWRLAGVVFRCLDQALVDSPGDL